MTISNSYGSCPRASPRTSLNPASSSSAASSSHALQCRLSYVSGRLPLKNYESNRQITQTLTVHRTSYSSLFFNQFYASSYGLTMGNEQGFSVIIP